MTTMIDSKTPALVLAPMEGITDAAMRGLLGSLGAFSYAVSEFLRVSCEPLPPKVFLRDIPELRDGAKTPDGMPVQIQILGGNPERMAVSAVNAVSAGAKGIDINFGCPAPTVNRHDGGASLLRHPSRIRDIVAAIRAAVPRALPVSAKLRLGWDSTESIFENAEMAAEGGASWITIHARTRTQGYQPPVFWPNIGKVRQNLDIPVVANGDIWTFDDFRRCQDETGCHHFMIGRSALADPWLPRKIGAELGTLSTDRMPYSNWPSVLKGLITFSEFYSANDPVVTLMKFKQWLKIAKMFGDFPYFDAIKLTKTLEEFFEALETGKPVVGSQKSVERRLVRI